jgi:AcrR family transcriptional regulator
VARRAAIVDATMALVVEHGANVTTRQIADAAGIAEGTIFRVFADKDELIDTVIDAALDPAPDVAAIEAIPLDLPLEAKLTAAVQVLQLRVRRVWQAMSASGATRTARGHPPASADPPEVEAIARLLASDAGRLRLPPLEVARRIRAVTFASTHPLLSLDRPSTPEEVVALLLDGLRAR